MQALPSFLLRSERPARIVRAGTEATEPRRPPCATPSRTNAGRVGRRDERPTARPFCAAVAVATRLSSRRFRVGARGRPRVRFPRAVSELIDIRRLPGPALREQLDALAAVLVDCVVSGASVSYMTPFSHAEARGVFEVVAEEVEFGRRLLLAAFRGGELVGTVQVILALPPNQPHRGEIAKLLVHRSARGRGVARALMTGGRDTGAPRGQDAAGSRYLPRGSRGASLRADGLDARRRDPGVRALP